MNITTHKATIKAGVEMQNDTWEFWNSSLVGTFSCALMWNFEQKALLIAL